MVICRKRNFIFLRVTKTASTSILHHLLDHIPRDEFDHVAQNDYVANHDERHRTKSSISGHATLGDIIRANLITHEEIAKMRIYAVMRNPVERYLSAVHHFHIGITHKVDFANHVDIQSNISNEEAIQKYLDIKFDTATPQWNWLLFNGSLINRIVLYPNFKDFFKEVGVPTELKYHHRKEHRKDDTRSEISQELKNKIINLYKKDWEIWNYLNS